MLSFLDFLNKKKYYSKLDEMFYNKVDFLIKNKNLLSLIVITGKKGVGKTYLLNLISKKLNIKISNTLNLRTVKEELLIDNFEEVLLLDDSKFLKILDAIKSSKFVVISINQSLIKNLNDKKALFLRSLLEEADYIVNLDNILTDSFYEKLVNEFLEFLTNDLNVSLKEDNKEFLLFFVKNKKLSLDGLRKLFLNIYLRLKDLKGEEKVVDIKNFFPSSILSNFYWYKEITSSKDVDISDLYTNKIKKLVESKKKEESMDINTIMNKYLDEEHQKSLVEKIKDNPSLIEENLFVSDYREDLIFKDKKISEIINDVQKPNLVGYKNENLYLIYVIDNIEELNVKDLQKFVEIKNNNPNVIFVIVSKNNKKNKELIEKFELNKQFKIVLLE